MSDCADHDEQADRCVPFAARADDDTVEAWFKDLAITPHRPDGQVSGSTAIWEQILVHVEALFAISRDDKPDPSC